MPSTKPQDIAIADYDYDLPDERIARYPLSERSSSKLLVYRSGEITTHTFRDLPDFLPEGSLIVRNNSKVIRARLIFHKDSGARIEIFCLDPALPESYELSLSSTQGCSWHCMLGNAKRFRLGTSLTAPLLGEKGKVTLRACRTGEGEVSFTWDNEAYTFGELLELMGILPIPPYLDRETEERDLVTYQTVYAEREGSVAAPTAGLHFTPEVFEALRHRGIETLDVTLHVGAGTFRPVKADHIGEHEMHAELISVSREAVEKLRKRLGSIIAIGTTSVRTLESLYHLGVSLLKHPDASPETLHVTQWQPYGDVEGELPPAQSGEAPKACVSTPSTEEAFAALIDYMQRWELTQLVFPTSIIIAPGYRYRVIRGMVTNFHQPHSTLLLLIAALVGSDWRRIYDYALTHDFRFLSYGDSSLLLP